MTKKLVGMRLVEIIGKCFAGKLDYQEKETNSIKHQVYFVD